MAAKSADSSTALATLSSYAIMQSDTAELTELLRENLAGEQLSVSDFDQIKMPTGGSTVWEIPTTGTASGTDAAKVIEGIVIFQAMRRLYWKSRIVENAPPDCYSPDLITGIGDPGVDCASCPNAVWGTATDAQGNKTRGQACKTRRLLYILFPDQVLPKLLSIPPTSLKGSRSYFIGLTSEQIPYWTVATRIGLTADKANGNPYSKVTFARGEVVSGEQLPRLRAYVDAIQPLLRQARPDVITLTSEEDDQEIT